ncbi:LLM class flavin-dependent oxidoreductase [Crossiella sp. SN42]|uniref:LLM class flavin-dependent oxidoreductase n=1 Tax=Crossiella sp. SN42 TaxID=2944808 RepID=UPI0027E0541E|nr:LLM class flavin-dependent oxidoreductase [Crossiella sp. SN42]
MAAHPVRLSVLDTSPIVQGATPRQALLNTVDLARLTDTLGYHRYWVPEHHGMRGVASSAPAVLIAHLANATTNLRLGSGAVLLPNHPPAVIAEQFATLTALHPNRIDLGIGRAPGGPKSAVAAVRPEESRTATPFHTQLKELHHHLHHPETKAIPARNGNPPPIWLLGSSTTSAALAATLGLPYAYAHHLNPTTATAALHHYRTTFRPTPQTPSPTTLISVSVITAETDTHAEWLAGPTRLKVLSRHHSTRIQLPSPETAAEYPYTEADRAVIATHSGSVLVGGPETVAEGLQQILDATGTTELMVTTPVYHHADRRRSYELLATIAPRLQVADLA